MRADLILVRHGEVDANWRERIYGCLDVPLSDNGRAEARRAAEHLRGEPVDAVFSSGLSRTRYGAECIASGRGLTVVADASLREIERGDWAGLSFAELAEREPGRIEAWRNAAWTDAPPGGESMGDLAARVLPTLDRIVRARPKRTLVVVAHSHVMRCALARVLGEEGAMQAELPTGAILHFDWTADDGPVELVRSETFETS